MNPSVTLLYSVEKTLTLVYNTHSCAPYYRYRLNFWVNLHVYSLALTQAGQNMEDSIVASYTALLLAVLAKNSAVCWHITVLTCIVTDGLLYYVGVCSDSQEWSTWQKL